MIDICMLTCNRARITETSIRTIHERTTMPYRLIVIDSGSTDGTPAMLTRLWDDGIIGDLTLLTENVGVHYGHNLLLAKVQSDPFVSTDDDIVPPVPVDGSDWLQRQLDLMSCYPDYAAISYRPHVSIGAGNMFPPDDAPEVKERSHAGASLRMMRTALVRQVGGWRNEKNPARNNEEWYVCGKLRNIGCKVGYARDLHCIHLFGKDEHNTEDPFGQLNEDPWGYPLGSTHGHRDIWPPVNHYSWERRGINWETCQ